MAKHHDARWEACKVHWKETGEWEEALKYKNALVSDGMGYSQVRRRVISVFSRPGEQPSPEPDDAENTLLEEVAELCPTCAPKVPKLMGLD